MHSRQPHSGEEMNIIFQKPEKSGGRTQSEQQPTALMPVLSLLLVEVLAIALPVPPAVCVIAATGLRACCWVDTLRILLSLS